MTANGKATLFTPVQIGAIKLKHRVVMAPLTRSGSIQPASVPGDLMAEYYRQRASDGGFIISEATNISITGRGWLGAPGLYSDQQVEGWKKVVSGVHAKDGHMFAQLWHAGRSSHVEMTGGEMPVSASVDPAYWQNPSQLVSTPSGWIQPSPHRALSAAEIPLIVEDYRNAAERAMDAGFEGVELHAANGYLVDRSKLARAKFLVILSEMIRNVPNPVEALKTLDAASEHAAFTREHLFDAVTARVRGELLFDLGRPRTLVCSQFQASIKHAVEQQARLFELRTWNSLAHCSKQWCEPIDQLDDLAKLSRRRLAKLQEFFKSVGEKESLVKVEMLQRESGCFAMEARSR